MKHRYKIVADGTEVREYYEFDQCLTEAEVKEIWLSDIEERWGVGVSEAFREHTEVTRITEDGKPALPCQDQNSTT